MNRVVFLSKPAFHRTKCNSFINALLYNKKRKSTLHLESP